MVKRLIEAPLASKLKIINFVGIQSSQECDCGLFSLVFGTAMKDSSGCIYANGLVSRAALSDIMSFNWLSSSLQPQFKGPISLSILIHVIV